MKTTSVTCELPQGSGLMKDIADQRTALMPGEFVVYNCTSPTEPLCETGSFFALECINGEITAPDVWPVCRPLGG